MSGGPGGEAGTTAGSTAGSAAGSTAGAATVRRPTGSGRSDDVLAVLTTAVLLLVTGAVLVVVLVPLGGAGVPATLADPGPATTVGLPLARYLQAALGVLVTGCAVVAALAPGEQAAVLRGRARRLLVPTALTLALVTVAVYQLTASDLSGRPLRGVLTGPVQQAFLGLPQARAQLLVLLAALVLAVAGRLPATSGRLGSAALLAVATAGLLPPAFVGHSAATADHELAVGSLSVHVVAGAMWVGGLAVLAALVLSGGRALHAAELATVRSFSTLALGCVVAVAGSGVLNASLRVTAPADLVSSAYGLLLTAKTALLVVLVGFGWWHRRRSVSALEAGAGRTRFVRLAVVELLVMVVTVAVAVVLARTPPPGV